MRILVTGASGFIGSWLAQALLADHEVLGLTFNSREPLPFRHRSGDLRSERFVSDILRDFGPQVVVHAAALSRVLGCEAHPEEARRVNVEATGFLARWSARVRARLIFLSSDQVFSGRKGLYIESDKPHPINVYGNTKLEAERLVLTASSGSLVIRVNSVIGPARGRGVSFSEWVLGHLRESREVTLFEDQYRSPIHIRSLVQILKHACIDPAAGLMHAGGPKRMNRTEVGYAIARSYGLPADTIRTAPLNGHEQAAIMPRDTSFNISLLRQWIPQLNLRPLDDELAEDAGANGAMT